MDDGERTGIRRRWRMPPVSGWLPWLGAFVAFVVAIQTAPEVLDVEAVEGGLLPLVAAAAAVPLGLIVRHAPLGWLLSAGSALLVSRTIPVVDGDPWPWPVVHGLVLLALVFAVALEPAEGSQAGRSRARQGATVLVVWLGTGALFVTSVPDHLRAGWAVGVTAVVAAGILLRWLGWLRDDDPETLTTTFTETFTGTLTGALAGLREAYVSWVPSPPLGPPLGERLLTRLSTPGWADALRGVAWWVPAFGVFWIGVASIRETLEVHDLALPAYAALIALPVGLIRHHALLGWRLITVLGIVVALVGTPSGGLDPGTWPVIHQVVWLAMTFMACVRHGRWTTIWIWLATVSVMSAGSAASESAAHDTGVAVTLIAAASGLALIADLLRSRRRASRDLARQTELSELEKARRTVLEERTRIARELHDIVAHHMSLVVVQAETAPYRIAGLPVAAEDEFSAISTSARQALTEIRAMLGVLRSDDTALTAPQPTPDQITDLVATAVRSGMPVSLATTGHPPERIGVAAGLSVYRIVQESLANAARHARGAPVTVQVDYSPDAVELRITNPPPAPPDPPALPDAPSAPGPPGHGLIGMRERASVVGGTFEAGPTPDGGFRVSATIPTDAEENPSGQ